MNEDLENDVLELIRLEKAKENAMDAWIQKFEKVSKEIKRPKCKKKAMVLLGKIKCQNCGLSTGAISSNWELYLIWFKICRAVDEKGGFEAIVKKLEALGG